MDLFENAVDIANRALDHCGATRISTTTGFSEISKNARLCSAVYDKLRRFELRRNTWEFATKKVILRAIDANTMLLSPALWVQGTTYFVGSIVADASGQIWISEIPNNLGNQPETSEMWAEYFGPMTVSLYASTVSYFTGELVYTTDGDGLARVYQSRESGNEDDPATATDWDATVTYKKNQVATFSSVAYMSRIDLNLNQTPTSSAADWAIATVYGAGDAVTGSDGVRYTSIAGGNVGNDPTYSPLTWTNTGILTPWTIVFTGGTGSLKWLQIGGAEFPMGVGLRTLNIVYPIGAGPSSQSSTRNAFRLPANFLRKCSSDPKAGANSYLGAPTGLYYNDWLFENGYLISGMYNDPIMLRFIADTIDVRTMDDMFCEGLAARIGLEICQSVTQSTDKLKTIASVYENHMTDARLVNAIETGSEEPYVDDYLACRA